MKPNNYVQIALMVRHNPLGKFCEEINRPVKKILEKTIKSENQWQIHRRIPSAIFESCNRNVKENLLDVLDVVE